MDYIKGTLKTVSGHKGLILEENPDKWYNIENSIKETISIDFLKSLIGTKIELELTEKGYYIQIKAVFENANEIKPVKTSKKTKILFSKNANELEIMINTFSLQKKVYASTPIVYNNELGIFLYYED